MCLLWIQNIFFLKPRRRQTFSKPCCVISKMHGHQSKTQNSEKLVDGFLTPQRRQLNAWKQLGNGFRRILQATFFQSLWNLNDISVKRREQKPAVVWVKFGYHPMFKALKYICHTMLKHSFSQFTMHKHDGLQRPRVIICTEVQFQLFQVFPGLPHDAAPQSDS